METLVREFEERDLDAVVGLSLRAWEPVFVSLEQALRASGTFPLMYPDGWRAAQRAAVTAACRDEGLRVWVAETGGDVSGFVAVRVLAEDDMGEIHMLAVDPARQRGGVGGLLTSFAVERIRESGVSVAMVETGGDPGHAPARRVYAAAGFTELPVSRYFMAL